MYRWLYLFDKWNIILDLFISIKKILKASKRISFSNLDYLKIE
jgi:hypothetical protein